MRFSPSRCRWVVEMTVPTPPAAATRSSERSESDFHHHSFAIRGSSEKGSSGCGEIPATAIRCVRCSRRARAGRLSTRRQNALSSRSPRTSGGRTMPCSLERACRADQADRWRVYVRRERRETSARQPARAKRRQVAVGGRQGRRGRGGRRLAITGVEPRRAASPLRDHLSRSLSGRLCPP